MQRRFVETVTYHATATNGERATLQTQRYAAPIRAPPPKTAHPSVQLSITHTKDTQGWHTTTATYALAARQSS